MTESVQTTVDAINILDQSLRLVIRFSRFGNRRKAGMGAVTVNAEKGLLALSKKLLASKEYAAIVAHDLDTKRWLQSVSLPFPSENGSYLIPLPMVTPVNDELTARQAKREELIDAFVTVYPDQAAAMEAELRDLYNAGDYPSVAVLRAKFLMEWNYLEYGVAGKLKTIDAKLFEAEREKLAGKVQSAAAEIQQALRAGMLDLVAHLSERLQPAEAGAKKKAFHATAITNLQQFLDTFDVRNLTNDAELKQLVEQARTLISGVDATQVRENEGLREALAQGFSNITAAVDALVVTEKTRKIQIEGDDDAEGGE